MQKKKIVILVLISSFLLVGCKNKLLGKAPIPHQMEVEVTDQGDRFVIVPQPIDNIVSTSFTSTSTIMTLNLNKNLIGMELRDVENPLYQLLLTRINNIPEVTTSKRLSLEVIASLKADLLILDYQYKAQAELLTDLGINVVVVNPNNIENFLSMVKLIGKVTSSEIEAANLINYYQAQRDLISTYQDEQPKKVYLGGRSSFLFTAVKDMFETELISMAGGTNCAQKLDGDNWTLLSPSMLNSLNPDIIIIPADATYSVEDVLNDERFAEITAIVNKDVYHVPAILDDWSQPQPTSIISAMWLTSILYEEEYSFERFIDDALFFYETFYGLEVNRERFTK